MSIIRVVTAVIRDADSRLLLVRKRGTGVFMQPGGKPEPGEGPRAALARELREEVGASVEAGELIPLGTFRAPAANEAHHIVEAEMFALAAPVTATAAGEIEEIWWRADDDASDRPVAPLTRLHVIGRL